MAGPDTKLPSQCSRACKKVSDCGKEPPDEYHVSSEVRYYDDEVKPQKWGLSEMEKWREEVTSQKYERAQLADAKKAMAKWRSIKEVYDLRGELDVGSFGKCFKGYCKTLGFMRSIVRIPKAHKLDETMARNEATLLTHMEHPNIASMAELIEDNLHLYLVLDNFEGGTLSAYIEEWSRLTETQSMVVMKQLLSAIAYLHEEVRICHRDLKLQNLVLSTRGPIETSNTVKLIDFRRHGCIFVKNGEFTDMVSTNLNFTAPEVLKSKYTQKCDNWSSGVIMYVLLCGQCPYAASSDEEIKRNVLNGNYNTKSKIWSHVTEACKTLLRGLLTYQPSDRLTAEAALNCDAITNRTPALQWS